MTIMEEQIRLAARKFLTNGEVSCVIGYERDSRGRVRPVFIEKAEDAEKLVWGADCNLNLVAYLNNRKLPAGKDMIVPNTAIMLRPCDARSIHLLINEQQLKRENIKIIGITCAGSEIDGHQRVTCNTCQERIPVIYDVLIEPEKPVEIPKEVDVFADITEMETWLPDQRMEYWKNEFDRCIRCYACRQACPSCYCFECVSEQVDPHWSSIAMDIPEKMFFHVMRAYHLAGRCVGCGACDAVCPMAIPLEKLNRKVAKEILDLFGYRTGDDPEKMPPMICFNPDERLKI
jgi:formate dehydrogenase subunit beta